MKGIIIDCETGSKYPEHGAVTQIGAVMFHQESNLLVETGAIEYYVIPHEEMFLCKRSLDIQNAEIGELFKESMDRHSETTAMKILLSGIHYHLGTDADQWRGKMWAFNAPFDAGFLHQLERRALGFNKAFPPQCNMGDVRQTLLQMMGLGKVPQMRTSLDACCNYFNIPRDTTKRHGALYDARLTLELMNHLLPLAGWL